MTPAANEVCGVLVVDKPAGVTSFDVVAKVRRLYGTKRVGHTGTLDPMATGVLVILLGRAAKAEEYLQIHGKRYVATLQLGMTTDTQDTTGTVLSSVPATSLPAKDEVLAAADAFVGDGMQLPPMYSALKVGGQKLVDLARRGICVEREPRPIHIDSLTAESTDTPGVYTLDVTCSGGTYIRTLCHDIGARLGCGGVMASLRRTAVGDFTLADAVSPEALERASSEERLRYLLPVESLFRDLPALYPEAFYAGLLRDGCAVSAAKLHADVPVGGLCTLWRDDPETPGRSVCFALGQGVVNDEGVSCVKCVKILVL